MTRLSRRAFMMGGTAALLASPARAQGVPVCSAAAFADSVGVNTHLGSEPYASRFGLVRELLAASGIRHVRDELRPSNDLARWRELFERHGIRSHLLVSPATNTVAEMLDYLAALGAEKVSAIEGQNEGDSDWFQAQEAARGGWAAAVTAYQRAVFQTLRERYPADVLPVLSPSVLDWKPGDMEAIRAAAPFCDMVAIHPYAQHGEEPETEAPYAALSWYLRQMRDGFKPGAPAMATEAGYNTLVEPRGAGVSEAAAAIYIPRLLLNNFAAGIRRTFLYELLDEGPDPAEWEQHWGLVRYDGTPKPAYRAVAALLQALDASQPGGVAVAAAFRGAPPEARAMQFRKADGSTIVAIWRAVRCFDAAAARGIAVDPVPLTVVPDRSVSQAAFTVLDGGTAWAELPVSNGAIAVPAGAGVVLLRFA
jgi:hypothetical protein